MTERPPIAFLINGMKPPRGGELLTLALVTRLSADLFTPFVMYMHDGPIVRQLAAAGVASVEVPVDRTLAALQPRLVNWWNPMTFVGVAGRLLSSYRAVLAVRRVLRERGARVLYCADNISKVIGGLAAAATGVRVCGHCHDVLPPTLLGTLLKILNLAMLDVVITVSDTARRSFAVFARVPRKVVTIYNGVDAATFDRARTTPPLADDKALASEFTVGAIGALDANKGHRRLFEAIASLKADGVTGIRVIVCGTGPAEETLRTGVRDLGIEREVRFLGFRSDIPEVLSAIDVLVVPTLFFESASIAAVEAMAMGVPVVASRLGGIPELVIDGETGLLVPPGDATALAQALRTLLEDPERRRSMGRQARQRVLAHFTLDRTIKDIEGVFRQLTPAVT